VPQSAGVLRVGRYFLSLAVITAVLYGLVFLPGQNRTPKLGLDLEGGAQIVFRAKTTNNKTPSKSSMNVAREILTNRVRGNGVSDAQVIQQGDKRIVVSVPGKSTKDLAGIGKAAQLNFRPLVMPIQSVTPTAPTESATPTTSSSGSAKTTTPTSGSSSSGAKVSNQSSSGHSIAARRDTPAGNALTPNRAPAGVAPTSSGAAAKSSSAKPSSSAANCTPTSPNTGLPYPFNCFGKGFALPTSEAAFQKLSQTQQQVLAQAMQIYNCATPVTDISTKGLIACNAAGTEKYMLGSVIVAGKDVSTAAAQPPNASQGELQWTVQLRLKGSAQKTWANYTSKHSSNTETADPTNCGPTATPCAEFVAFTLDEKVITAPHNQGAITGDTQISGSFTESSATELANQLKYGALPLDFTAETTQNVSPTLGSSQLKSGLLAGGIGLVLVVLYSLLYYRGLGLVTIASLLVSGALTYACLVILGREIGFTLTLAGIAGFIVAVGITADSFVVFFERIKDEVHEGRSMRVAVPRAWTRARRTIVSADFVSFLAAAVLYYLASGDVRGFAFTLGLSTILDLVVVFLFTHPLISVLSGSRAFGSPRFTGLNALRGPAPALAGATAGAGAVRLVEGQERRAAAPTAVAAAEPAAEEPAEAESALEEAPRPKAGVSVDTRSAAERAAARRGRTLPPEPASDDVEDVEEASDDADGTAQAAADAPRPSSARRRWFGRRAPEDETPEQEESDAGDPSDEVDEEPEPVADVAEEPAETVEPDPVRFSTPVARTAVSSSAAERAAERRRRRTGAATAESAGSRTGPEPDVEAEPEDEVTAETESQLGTEADDDPGAEADDRADAEGEEAEAAPSGAAARAAARRARIRARATAKGGSQ
jgi:preprotein translocase subunit SecD